MRHLVLSLAYFVGASAYAGSFTYDDLVKIVGDPARNISTIDDLLAQPAVTAAYRSGYTAMFKSRSIQGAEPLNPRIILYGEDAKLVMAFTCAPGDCGGHEINRTSSLEVMHWVEADSRFEFQSLDFPEGLRSGGVVISKPNPELCLSCHMQPDPRPNWEAAFSWPGAYGGEWDHLNGMRADGESFDNLKQFLATGEKRPRYRQLVNLAYGYERRYYASADNIEHNYILNVELDKLNLLRILDRMRKSFYYQNLKYGLWLEAKNEGRRNAIVDQLKAAGLNDAAAAADTCIHNKYFYATMSATAEIARLVYALDKSSQSWFMGFLPTLHSALGSAEIDSDFIQAEVAGDASIQPSLPDDQKMKLAAQGWKELAKKVDLKAGFAACSAAQALSLTLGAE